MENTYGIGITNRYALFLNDDDADPLEVLKSKEQEKELKKKTKVAEKENKVKTEAQVKQKSAPVQRKGIKETQNVKPQEKREEKPKNGPARPEKPETRTDNRNVKFSNENREERNNRRNRDDSKPFNGPSDTNRFNRDDRPPRREFRADGENSTGDNNLRGGRGGLQGARPRQPRGDGPRRFEGRGKREFDRQSGSDKTGVKAVDKREGGGAHNWGSHKDDIEEANKIVEGEPNWDSDKNDTVNETKEVTAGGDAPVEETPAAPVEEEVKELTLDEWKAQRAQKLQKPQYNIRKAGEGEDLTQWKKMYALNKKQNDEDESEEEEYDASEYPQRVGRQKHVLDIDIRFSDSRRGGPGGRGPRGGRGGPRGERGGPGRDRALPPKFRNNEEQVNEEKTGGGGGGGGGGHRNEKIDISRNNRQAAPKVDDEHDFPSLG